MNAYSMERLARERLMELRREADQHRLLRTSRKPRPPLRPFGSVRRFVARLAPAT